MKKSFTLLLLALSIGANAQLSNWYKADLSKIGYRSNSITFENAPNNQFAAFSNEPFRTVKGGSFELSTEIFGKNVYFGMNGSFLLDVGKVLWTFKPKERWYKNNMYSIDRGELIPVQLAFGSNIGKYFAIYAGGQYQYTTLGIDYTDSYNQYRDVYIGGNQRGAGIHLMAAYKFIHIRYSYMHDWMKAAKTFTGMAYTHELVAHVGINKIGFFVKFNQVFREMDGGYFPDDRKERTFADLPDDYKMLPSERAKQFSFSIGIYATGIFSGVTQAGARAVTQTEVGLRNKRNEDKQRKIEYKE
ncbi:MAG: hypothetical protein R2809_14825 [Flavobacteriales bacterium]